MMKQTRATINNYGTCFLQGIGVEKNKEKAKEIFQIGVSQNDLNSIYKMGIILMDTDPTNSLKFFKQSAEGGCIQAQKIYARIISKTNINESLKYYNYASDQGDVESQEILAKMHQKDFSDLSLQKSRNTKSFEFSAKKYSNENILENENIYMHLLIKSGNYKIPMEHALNLYNSKQFTQAYNYFIEISKFNHPIAKYFIGIMKFKGQGCQKDKEEAFEIMKFLSKQGVGKATDFLNNHFNK